MAARSHVPVDARPRKMAGRPTLAWARHWCPPKVDVHQFHKGVIVELEHTTDWQVARTIALDHLAEHPRYYDYLEAAEERMKRGAKPNRSRMTVIDAEDMARNMRETFHGTPSRRRMRFDFDWPETWQHVGESLAVAYASDKADPELDEGPAASEQILYKHLAESRNQAFCLPDLLYDADEPSSRVRVRGPLVSFADVPMPAHFAELALFEEINLRLFTEGTNLEPGFGPGKDDGCITATIKHGMVGGAKLLWSQVSDRRDEPFLFVYNDHDGPLILVVGETLDVRREGIVG